jgi:hypothetical protein
MPPLRLSCRWIIPVAWFYAIGIVQCEVIGHMFAKYRDAEMLASQCGLYRTQTHLSKSDHSAMLSSQRLAGALQETFIYSKYDARERMR